MISSRRKINPYCRRVAQVLRFGQSVGGLVEHKEFVLSSRFGKSKVLLSPSMHGHNNSKMPNKGAVIGL